MSAAADTDEKLLAQIIETPGWSPMQPIVPEVEEAIQRLYEARMIIPRLDGWEASGAGLEHHQALTGEPPLRFTGPQKCMIDVVVSADRRTIQWGDATYVLQGVEETIGEMRVETLGLVLKLSARRIAV